MHRRNFLKGLAGTVGTVVLESCAPSGLSLVKRIGVFEYERKLAKQRAKNIHRIYNELPKHVYPAETETEIRGVEDIDIQEGAGIVIDGNYLTMAHIINSFYDMEGENLNELLPPEMLFQETFLYERKLKKVVVDDKKDVAIFKLPNDLKLPNFPAKPSSNINLGDPVFVIGNPGLRGTNTRRGYVSDLDGLEKLENEKDSTEYNKSVFGIDIYVSPGDSGCPVVSSDFKLLGLVAFDFYGLGYVQRIGEFLKYL